MSETILFPPVPSENLLHELFERDPHSLTQADRKVIIDYYAAKKYQFDAAAEQGKKPSRAKPKAASAKGTAVLDDNLKNLLSGDLL